MWRRVIRFLRRVIQGRIGNYSAFSLDRKNLCRGGAFHVKSCFCRVTLRCRPAYPGSTDGFRVAMGGDTNERLERQ